jgi:hypothetical protein
MTGDAAGAGPVPTSAWIEDESFDGSLRERSGRGASINAINNAPRPEPRQGEAIARVEGRTASMQL